MRVKPVILFLLLIIQPLFGLQAQGVKVLTLGTFHFAFPNRDVEKIEADQQIDVLLPRYQDEIEELTDRLAEFKPTRIAIEASPSRQSRIDSLYSEYLAGNHALGRDESEQIGFRLARKLNISKLYCTNDWGTLTENVERVLDGSDSAARRQFMDSFYVNPDSLKMYSKPYVYKNKGILEELRELNQVEHLKKDLGNYLISVFKYQTADNAFFGVDFTSGWWFNRNLRIFRNIQMIPAKQDDRILVIYGSGHMNLLNIFFDASPEYDLVDVNDYLE